MENNLVDEAVTSAKSIGETVRKQLFSEGTLDDFVEIDQTYPAIMATDQKPIPKEEAVALHEEYVDRISKQLLSHSLFLGLGFEAPTNHALSEAAVYRHLSNISGQVTHGETEEGYFEFVVIHPGSNYTFIDTDRWLGGLRALHFFSLRHDPDLIEFVNRKLAQSAGLDDAWAEKVRGS